MNPYFDEQLLRKFKSIAAKIQIKCKLQYDIHNPVNPENPVIPENRDLRPVKKGFLG